MYQKAFGLIVRTAGVGKSPEELQWDLKVLLHHWEAIKQASQSRPAPFLIHQESDVIVRAIRDYLRRDIGEILIDSPKVFEKAKAHIKLVRPDFINRVKLYQAKCRYLVTIKLSHKLNPPSSVKCVYLLAVRLSLM